MSSLGDDLAVNCTWERGCSADDILSRSFRLLAGALVFAAPFLRQKFPAVSPSQQSKRGIFLERPETKEIGERRPDGMKRM